MAAPHATHLELHVLGVLALRLGALVVLAGLPMAAAADGDLAAHGDGSRGVAQA